jgi:hypothetical protein
MATEDYVPVTGDDWYQRRREDAEGKFFRSVVDQGPRKGDGGSTRQGIYCLTADGKLLAYKNAGQAPDVMREVLKQGLAEWRKLPESRRKPGAVQVGSVGQIDGRFSRTPPPGGLIINVYARCLDRDAKGELCDAACEKGRGDEASRDHLWLTEAEWRSLVPAGAKSGDTFPLPDKIADRIFRFHLLDNTRGEPNMWSREEVRSRAITLTVEESTPAGMRVRLEGSALMATHADSSQAERGYDVQLLGYIHYDVANKVIDRFDVVAAGDHWGEGNYTRGARPGRTPLGVAFELASGKSPADRVPPQAARDIGEYLK